MIRTIVADGAVTERQKLRQLLIENPEIEIVGESATAEETIALVRSAEPDLLFVEVCMPGAGGFGIVKELDSLPDIAMPHVVFTAADDSHALRAFEVRALDCVPKPCTAERLRSTLQRVRERIAGAAAGNGHGEKHTRNGKAHNGRMIFKSRGRILFLPVSDIRWIAAEENYVRICTGSGTHLLRETMTRVEERLDKSMFLRVHRSAIVNLQFVKEVRTEPPSTFSVIMMNGQRISMSRSYHSRVGGLLARGAAMDFGAKPVRAACA